MLFGNAICMTSCLPISFFFFEHLSWLGALTSEVRCLGHEPCAIFLAAQRNCFMSWLLAREHR